jgi:hypothetical protein
MLVLRLKPYIRAMEKIGFDDDGMRGVERDIAANPLAHPVIRGLKGVRKARFARPGTGKRGGGRVVYYLALSPDRLFMLTAYPKSRDENESIESACGARLESGRRPGRSLRGNGRLPSR